MRDGDVSGLWKMMIERNQCDYSYFVFSFFHLVR